MATVAWIGLGHMGGPMTANLVKAGHRVQGFDLVPVALDAAVENGVIACASAAEAIAGADVVFTMLPRGEHVLGAYGGENGILALAAPGTLLVDSSTIDVASARAVHEQAAAQGFDFVDAPVSGGISGAAAGTLTFMVGGETAAVERARPLIEPMAKTFVHTGPATTGQAAKICNNLMLAISLIGLAEGTVLADRLGLDHRVFFELAQASSGDSWPLRTWYPYPGVVDSSPANRDFAPTFTADLLRKDLGLALAAGEETGTPLAHGAAVHELLDRIAEAGSGGMDCTIVRRAVDGSLEL